MKSYIKLYGPPVLKALKALEKMAVDLPEVCIMDSLIEQYFPEESPIGVSPSSSEGHAVSGSSWAQQYFSPLSNISVERCDTIVSKSGETLGEYDFFYEWFTESSVEQLNDLVEKIDETLKPIGVRYSITTKK